MTAWKRCRIISLKANGETRDYSWIVPSTENPDYSRTGVGARQGSVIMLGSAEPLFPVVLELPADAAGQDEIRRGRSRWSSVYRIHSSCVLPRKVVEAAGVEPASGTVLHGEPTYLVRSKVSTDSSERTRLNPSSPIVCQPCAPDRSLGPIPPDDALRPHAGLWTRAAA